MASRTEVVQRSAQDKPVVRQRKAHRKSRLGCANCKMRGVKCDESKPSCQRCEGSGFTCNYSFSAPALQFSQAHIFKVDLKIPQNKMPDMDLRRSIPLAHPVAGKFGSYELREDDVATLSRFLNTTVFTLGPASPTYRSWFDKGALGLSNTYPFLFHIYLVLAHLHDIHVKRSNISYASSHSLAFHWYHGTALFHQMLARAIKAPALSVSERDTLWIGAAMLGTATFAYQGSLDPQKAWPLDSSSNLDWLKMTHGKEAVWKIADLTRSDSMFTKMLAGQELNPPPDGRSPIRPHTLPPLFYPVFNLSAESTAENNPYHAPACIISQLLDVEPAPFSVHQFLTFLTQVDERYTNLLEAKDPPAIILMLYWMAKMAAYPMWWVKRRSLYEGLAMTIYIEKHCSDQPDLLQLIEAPKATLQRIKAEDDAESQMKRIT